MGRHSKKKVDSKVSGCVLIDKPEGCTSHDVVDQVRGALQTRKVGHAGTLDPDATGVLVLGIGAGTKLLEFVVGAEKSYEGIVSFGVETSTLDAAGEVVAEYDMDLTLAQVQKAAVPFVGAIEQIPPMVSAVKIGGKRLHELHREGIEIERPPRQVVISSLHVESTENPLEYKIFVSCSSGTYIRSLAADLGTALGGGAHLHSLRRTAVGKFSLSDTSSLSDVTLLPLETLLRGMPVLEVGDDLVSVIRNGRSFESAGGSGLVAVKSSSGDILAVYRAEGSVFVPAKILPH